MSGGRGGPLDAPYSPSSGSSSNSAGNGVPSLRVSRQPPSHEFPGAWFEIELRAEATAAVLGKQRGGDGGPAAAVEVRAELCGYDVRGGRPGEAVPPSPSGPELAVEGGGGVIRVPLSESPPPSSGGGGGGPPSAARASASVRCRIRSGTRPDRVTAYCVRFAPASEPRGGGSPPPGSVQPVYTEPIVMVSARLRVDAHEWEKIWYKDEGGRDKCMSADATLCDSGGTAVRGRRVPLRMTLLYDNEQSLRVMKQETLRVMGPLRRYVDPDTARASLQFRIEDVSKNHQGMDFKVEVSADPSRAADVAPACTPPVSVRSKRNKRQRSTASSSGIGGAAAAAAGAGPPGPGPPPGGVGIGVGGGPGGGTPSSLPPRSPVRSYGDPRGTQAQAPPMPQGFSGVSDVARLRRAMKGVIQWTEEVVNGLYPLKWQVIGYAQFPDGTVDYNRPYHSMPNPNAVISRVLSMYSDETRENLQVLLSAVENTRAGPPPPHPLPEQQQQQEPPSPYHPASALEPQPIGPRGPGAGQAQPPPGQQQPMSAQRSPGPSGPPPMPYGTPGGGGGGGPGMPSASYGSMPPRQGLRSPWDQPQAVPPPPPLRRGWP